MEKLKVFAVDMRSRWSGSGLFNVDFGWGNGYLVIPEGHPLHGMDYDAIHEAYPHLSVNGGLTYAAKPVRKMVPDDVPDSAWIIGFDTAHLGDTLERWPDEASVLAEAQSLANQIESLFE